MKMITKKQFRDVIMRNKLNCKEIMRTSDYLKAFFLKKPYLHLIWKQLSPLFNNLDDASFSRFVDFCVSQGYYDDYCGDKGVYSFGFLSFILNKYYVVNTDTKKVADFKINNLWNVFQSLSSNIEFNARDKGIDMISKVIGALIEQTNNYSKGV